MLCPEGRRSVSLGTVLTLTQEFSRVSAALQGAIRLVLNLFRMDKEKYKANIFGQIFSGREGARRVRTFTSIHSIPAACVNPRTTDEPRKVVLHRQEPG